MIAGLGDPAPGLPAPGLFLLSDMLQPSAPVNRDLDRAKYSCEVGEGGPGIGAHAFINGVVVANLGGIHVNL
jgi:hypothetical protein